MLSVPVFLSKSSVICLKKFQQWTAFLDPEGRVMDSKALRKKVFYGGVEHVLRKEVYT